MKKSLNRALALLLALTLMVGMVPAYAIGGEESVAPPVEEGIAPETPETPATTPAPDGETVVPLAPPPEGGDLMDCTISDINIKFNTLGEPVGTIRVTNVPAAQFTLGVAIVADFEYRDGIKPPTNDALTVSPESYKPGAIDRFQAAMPYFAFFAEKPTNSGGDTTSEMTLYVGVDPTTISATGFEIPLQRKSPYSYIDGEAIKAALGTKTMTNPGQYNYKVMVQGVDNIKLSASTTNIAPDVSTAPRATLEAKPIKVKGTFTLDGTSGLPNGFTPSTVGERLETSIQNTGTLDAKITEVTVTGSAVLPDAGVATASVTGIKATDTIRSAETAQTTFAITNWADAIDTSTVNCVIHVTYLTGDKDAGGTPLKDTLDIPVTLTPGSLPNFQANVTTVKFVLPTDYASNLANYKQTITITNGGDAPGKLQEAKDPVNGDIPWMTQSVSTNLFDVKPSVTLGSSVAANGTFTVEITPPSSLVSGTTYSDVLNIYYYDETSTDATATTVGTVYISLDMEIKAPTDPALTANPSAGLWSYASGEAPNPASKTFNIKNNGGAATGISATLTTGTDFEITTQPAGTLASGATATVVVTPKTKTTTVTFADTLTVKAGNGGTSATINLTQTVTAPATHIATVVLTKDGNAYGSQAVKLSLAETGSPLIDTTEKLGTAGTYESAAIAPGDYFIFVNGVSTGVKVNTTNAAATAPVNYFTVTATAGTGAQTAKVNGTATAVVQFGETATLAANPATGYTDDTTPTWTLTPATPSSVTGSTITVTGTVTATASFKEEQIILTTATVALTYGDDFTSVGKTLCTATGGTGSYTYAVTGAVPGLTHEGTTNVWKGRPTTVNTTGTQLTVTATSTVDSSNTATAAITVTVNKATPTVALTMGGTHYAGEDTKAAATVTITAPYYNSSSAWVDAPTAPNGGWAADSQISYDKAKILAGANTYTAKFTPAATGTNYAAIYENASGTSASYTPGTKTALTAATIVNTTHNGKPGALNDTLTCSYTPNTVTPVTYQWYTATAATGGTGTTIASANAATYTVTAADYGKYIYCVVDATKSTNGSGSVITSRIPVNYTGSVKLQLDDGTGTPTAADYAIMLHNPADSDHSKDVSATSNSGTNPIIYTTDAGALTGGVTYDVYVKAFAGQTAGSEVKVDGITVSAGAVAPTVNYYTVKTEKAVTASAYTTLDVATVTVTAKLTNNGGAVLASGTPVLAGQKVFIAQTALDAKYDYKTTWTDATINASNELEASIASVTAPVTAKATLTLNTYTIYGTAGGSTTDPNDGITTLTMSGTTTEGIAFTATNAVTNHSANGAEFTGVPKGTYSIDATKIVIVGEYAYTQTGSSGVSDATTNTFAVVSSAVNDLFTVATVGAKYAITLKAGSAAAGNDNTAITSTLAELTYGYTAGSTETITVTNTGNRTLYNMKVNNGTAPGTEIVATSTTDPNLLTATGIDLAPTDTATFVVKTNTGLDANNAYIQGFTVTANKADTGSVSALGSGVTYTATQKVAAKPLTAVTISGTAKDGAKLTRDTVSTATGNIANPDAAKTLAYQWQISDTSTGGYSNIVGETNSSYTVKPADAGKYLKLVVTGTGNYSGSATSDAKGPVAYTGTVNIQVDGAATITSTAYTVYLRLPNAADATGQIAATYTSENRYVTAKGALDGIKSYDVWVNDVSGASTAVKTDQTITPAVASQTATVDYYTVTITNPVEKDVTHAKDNSTTPKPVGEDFKNTFPAITAATSTGTAVATGKTVLKNTKVTFKSGTWTPDYTLEWNKNAAATDIKQDSATASGTGYSVDTVTEKITVTSKLAQNTYAIAGTISGNGQVASATLTNGSYVFKGTVAGNGDSTNAVTFNVPKSGLTTGAITGAGYTLAAAGKTSPDTTILGYATTNPSVTSPEINPAAIAVTAAKNPAFKIFIDAATYTVKLQHDINFDTSDNYADANAWTYSGSVYGYSSVKAVKVKLVNTGNTTLNGLTAIAGTGADKFTVSALSATTMAKGDAVTFTITPNKDLAAGTYTVPVVLNATETLTTAEADRTYTLTFEVAKAKITAAAVTGVVQPVNGTALADTATIQGSVNYTIQKASGKNVVWSPVTTPAAPGTAYTATVVLVPNANYEFDTSTATAPLTGFTINTKSNGVDGATGTVAADKVTLTLTFPATAPTVATATLEATSFDKATATATVDKAATATATVKYGLHLTAGAPAIGAANLDTQIWNQTVTTGWIYPDASGNFTGLASYSQYTLYAVAKVTVGGVESPLSAVATATPEKTFHKVTVNAGSGTLVTPTVAVGVDDGVTQAISVTPPTHYVFDKWTTSDTTREVDITTKTNPGVYTANVASAAEVTLTATYEASYGITYDVQGGSATATDNNTYRASGTVTTQPYNGTKTGFTFGGWSAKADGTSPITAGNTVTIAALAAIQTTVNPGGSYTLYAVWTPKAITAAATAMAAGTYGTAGYNYAAGNITAQYNDGAAGVPGTVVTQANLSFVQKLATSEEKTLTDLGLALNTSTGAITGRPRQVGTFKFTVTVTDSVSGSKADVQLTLTVGKATPTLAVKYAAGTYYADDPYDSAKLTSDDTNKSVATAPYYDGSKWVDLDAQVVDGAFAFTTPTGNYVSGPTDYGVTFTPGSTGTNWKNGATNGAANVLYNTNAGTVSITAIGKTYGITLVDSTTTTSAANGTFAEGVYLNGVKPTVTFKIQNKGNQKVTLTAGSYVLSGAGASNFVVTNPVTSVDGSAISTDTVTVTMKTDNLKVATYAETLTVTDNYNNKVTLDLSYTVTPKEIPGAAITGLVVPAKGVALDSAVVTDAGNADVNGNKPYEAQSIKWTPAHTNAAAGTVYTATVTLTANANYKFAASTKADNTGNYTIATATGATVAVTGTTAAGGTVTYTVTFPATAPGTLTMAASATSHTAGKIDKLSVSPIAVNADFFYVVSTATKTYADGAALQTDYTAGVTGTIVKVGTAANVADVSGKAEVLNTVLDTLAAGTTYYIYAVAANTGTALYSNVASAEITTDYQVTVALDGTNNKGTVNVGTYYVKKGSTQNLTATPHAGYKFDKWTVDAENGTFTRTGGSETGPNNYAFAPAIYTPTGNVTITGAFVGIPVLTVTGTPTGNEVAEGYDAATINVYENGVLKNEGGGNMTGTLAYAIVGKGGGFATTNSNTDFTVKLGATTALAVNGTTTIEVHPATGLKMNSDKLPKSYEATIWVYETGNDTNRCKLDVKVVVVDPNGLVVNPADKEWNLQSGATNTNWIITVTEGSFNTFESLKFGSVILDGTSAGDATGSDYTYTVNSGVGTLTIPTTYLEKNATSKKAGDKDVFTLTMQSSGATTAEKTLTLTYVNSTPTVNSVEITYNNSIVKGSVLTAIPTVSSGTPTTGQVTYAWYSTTLDSVPDIFTADNTTIWEVQANGNGNTYTVKDADAGKKFFVVATGDSTHYLGKAKSILTGAGGVTVAVEAVPTVGGTVTTDSKTVAIGSFVNITATAAPGYLFTGWSIKTSSGEGKFDNNTTGGTTSTIANTTFYPTKDSTLQAKFDKLPTVTPTTASYDVGNNPGTPNTIPVLTYAQNNGDATVTLKSKGSTDAEITLTAGTDYTFAQSGVGAASGTYTLTEAGLKKMQVDANTLTFDNNKPGSSYDCAATITITKTMNQINGATLDVAPVVGTTVTVTATANHGTPNADTDLTYQWYVSDTATNVGGTAIDGATSKTYVVPLTATVGGTANTSLIGKYLYAVATGTGTNFEGAATTAVQKIPNPIYTVTANGESAKGKVSVNGKTAEYTGVTGTVELGKSVNLSVTPDAGYKFSKWTLATANAGSFTSANGGITEVTAATASDGTATFFPTANATVNATFVPGTITFADSANGVAKYMTQTLQTVPTVSATSDVGGVTFTYTEAGTSDSYNGNAVPTSTKPAWLTLANNGTFSVTGSSWIDTDLVKNSTTEVVVYVKATASAGGVSKVAKVTIDLIPGDLTVTAPTYTAAKPTVGDTLDVTKFTANVQNAKAEKLETTGVAVSVDGTWVVAPATATGTNETYTLTYTYKKNAGGAISNYNTGTTTLTIAANPASSGIGVSENNAGVYATAQNRALNVTYPASVDTTYTVSVKNTGSSKLYDITLSTAADAATKAMFTLVDNGVNSKAELNGSAVAGTFTLTPTGDAAKVGIHEITYTVEGWTGDNGTGTKVSATYTLTVTVTAATVAGVKVTVPAPVTGDAIKNQPEITISGGKTDFNGTTVTNDAGTTLPDGTKVKVEWMEETTPGVFAPTTDTTFLPNKVYKPVITVKVDGNHKLPAVDANSTINTNTNGNGGATITVASPDTAGNNVVLEQTFPKTKVNEIAVTASATYDTDLSAANKPISANPALYTVVENTNATTFDNWKWYESDGTTPLKGNKFGRNTTYYVEAKVTVAPGANFEEVAKLLVTGNSTSLTSGLLTGAVEKFSRDSDTQITVKFKVTTGGPGGGGGGGGGETTLKVTYDLSKLGTTKDKTSESVVKGEKPKNVPAVTPKEDYAFAGWAETKDMKDNEKDPILVDPTTVVIEKSKTFYAIYKTTGEHEHYIVGYLDGNFGPADSITRGEVAAIIARSCMEGFEMKKDYGTGGYSDIDGSHWATSAIAFCSNAKIYVGYDDGTFRPDQAITRQEFAQLFARLSGMLSAEGKDVPFTDKGDIANWALDGVYTTVEKEWVVGYEDGTFKPNQDIARAEAVRIVNGYLVRGVNKSGLKMVEKDLKQWPDVPTTHWAYTEILEASNDHTFYFVNGKKPPEGWSKAFIEAPHWNQ